MQRCIFASQTWIKISSLYRIRHIYVFSLRDIMKLPYILRGDDNFKKAWHVLLGVYGSKGTKFFLKELCIQWIMLRVRLWHWLWHVWTLELVTEVILFCATFFLTRPNFCMLLPLYCCCFAWFSHFSTLYLSKYLFVVKKN